MCVCVRVCVRVYNTHTYNIHTHTHECTAHTHTYTQEHIHTHTHTHLRARSLFITQNTPHTQVTHSNAHTRYRLANSKLFDVLMTLIVLVNIALMSITSYKQTHWQTDISNKSEAFFSSIFCAEAFVRVLLQSVGMLQCVAVCCSVLQ